MRGHLRGRLRRQRSVPRGCHHTAAVPNGPTCTEPKSQAVFIYRQEHETQQHTPTCTPGTHNKEQTGKHTATCHMQVTYSNRHTHTHIHDSLLIHTCWLSTCSHFTLVHRCAGRNAHSYTNTHCALCCRHFGTKD